MKTRHVQLRDDLRQRGYDATLSKTRTVLLRHNNLEYTVWIDRCDRRHFCVRREFWTVLTADEQMCAERAARAISAMHQGIQIFSMSIYIVAELNEIMPHPNAFLDDPQAYIDRLETAIRAFALMVLNSLPRPPMEPIIGYS